MRSFLFLVFAALLYADDRWLEIRSGPFQVISNAGDKAAREQMTKLEQFRQALGVVLGKPDLQLVWPLRVLVVKGAKQVDLQLARDSYVCAEVPLKALARLLIEQNTKRLPAGIENGIVELFS